MGKALRRCVNRRAWLLLGIVVCSIGCSADYGPAKDTPGLQNLHSVVGSVVYKGRPTPGAIVMFFKEGKVDGQGLRIAGTVDEDGDFEMETTVSAGTRLGVQPGKYIVTVSWNEKVDPSDKDSDDGPDLVPTAYKVPGTSTLRAVVEEGDNQLEPFVLQDS